MPFSGPRYGSYSCDIAKETYGRSRSHANPSSYHLHTLWDGGHTRPLQ